LRKEGVMGCFRIKGSMLFPEIEINHKGPIVWEWLETEMREQIEPTLEKISHVNIRLPICQSCGMVVFGKEER
jgi:hypothetical protein